MSYARFSEGDVYVFQVASDDTGYCCMICSINPRPWGVYTVRRIGAWWNRHIARLWHRGIMKAFGTMASPYSSWYCKTPQEMITHLEMHVAAGHEVPERALECLREECESEPS